ncbi:uncharacterized protein WM277_001021 [Molossus nigricans]
MFATARCCRNSPAPPSPARRRAPAEHRERLREGRRVLRWLQWSKPCRCTALRSHSGLGLASVRRRLCRGWRWGGERFQLWVPSESAEKQPFQGWQENAAMSEVENPLHVLRNGKSDPQIHMEIKGPK